MLSLILQIVTAADALSQATMNKPLTAAIQEHVVCRKYFEQHEEEFQSAIRIEDPMRQRQSLESLRAQVLAKCGVRP